MARKIETIPTEQLEIAQKAIDFASREMHGFFQQVRKDGEEGKVRGSYVEELEESLYRKVQENNAIIESIDKELFKRINKMFPKATTPHIMPRLVSQYEKELAEYAANASEEKEVKSKLHLVSNEKVKE